MLKKKSILKFIFVIVASLLLTSCQTGSNIEQSSCSSESAQSAAFPEEVTLFGKPLSDVDWNNAISIIGSSTTPEGEYVGNIVKTLFCTIGFPYPEYYTETPEPALNGLMGFVVETYRNGFNHKTLNDFPLYDKELSQHKIPLEDVVLCLNNYFGSVDNWESILKASNLYLKDDNSCLEPLGLGGGISAVLIDQVTLREGNILEISTGSLVDIPDQLIEKIPDPTTVSEIKELPEYSSSILTIRIFNDHWQCIKWQKVGV